jgi:hypothetical protein
MIHFQWSSIVLFVALVICLSAQGMPMMENINDSNDIVLLPLAAAPRVTKKNWGTLDDNESNDIRFRQLANKLARGDIEPPTSLGHQGSRLIKRDEVNGVVDCEQLGSVFVVCKMTPQKKSDYNYLRFGRR